MGRKSYSQNLPSLPAPDFQDEPTETPEAEKPGAEKPGAEYYTLASPLVDPDTGETNERPWDGPFASKRLAGQSLADAGLEGIILRKVGAVVFEVVRKARVS